MFDSHMTESNFEYTTVSNGEVTVYTTVGPTHGNNVAGHIIIIPGWGEPAEVAKDLAREFSEQNYAASIIDYGGLGDLKRAATCGVDASFPITERARACAVAEFIDSLTENVYIVAHSQGAVTGILAAEPIHKKVRAIILVAPAGIINLRFLRLSAGFLRSFFLQLAEVIKTKDRRGKKYFAAVGWYIGLNPIQLIRDALGLFNTDILPLIHKVAKYGISVHIMCSATDRVFPLKDIKLRVADICPVHVLEGSHDGIFLNSEQSAPQIVRLFDNDH
ncbi:hypothetical protein CL652_02830 [bacterium]|nr:hypothetical protein [bacterium]|tara:strand:- start:2612 stop:3439 length:828 start_codon:yes stop_codon:yes gene_type:complete